MIFTKLILENFGVFKGKQVFDLEPDTSTSQRKPIILVGGKNGSGKTTLFEAIRLCLYGQWIFGKKLSNPDYEHFIIEKIHHSTSLNQIINHVAVELEFIYSDDGQLCKYDIRRAWEISDSKVKEKLTIYKNGEILSNLDSDQWQDFVKELIPQGLSQLFFFDGEKIQNLANEQKNGTHLMDSLNSLLGLDLVDSLKTDLSILRERKIRENGSKEIIERIKEGEKGQRSLEEQLNSFYQNKTQLQSRIEGVKQKIEKQEEKIVSEGGKFAEKREKYKLLIKKLDLNIQEVETQIRDLCSGVLPFALTPNYCLKLKDRLLKEEKHQKWKASQVVLKEKIKRMGEDLNSEHFWDGLNVSKAGRKGIVTKILKSLNREIMTPKDLIDFKPIHQLSPPEQDRLLGLIDEVLSKTPVQIDELTKRLEKLIQKRQNAKNRLSKVPSDDVLGPLVKHLNELHHELGAFQQKADTLDDEIQKVEFKSQEIQWQIQRETEKLKNCNKVSTRLELIEKVQGVLDEYNHRFTKQKVKELEKRFLKCFNKITRKTNFVEKIRIDPEDFQVTLSDKRGHAISKDQLSAGEKQLYAVAMLWALTKVSGWPIPIIIDTPLARLDSDHRGNLVTNFLPQASHQIIILSTDTEIDKQYFNELTPFITHAYHLNYDSSSRMTKIENEYFWKPEMEAVT